VQLSVGAAEQTTVSVNAGNPVTELNTENAEVSGTITGKEVQGIQLNGRNFSQLIALAPGVSNQTQQDEARVGMAGGEDKGSLTYELAGDAKTKEHLVCRDAADGCRCVPVERLDDWEHSHSEETQD